MNFSKNIYEIPAHLSLILVISDVLALFLSHIICPVFAPFVLSTEQTDLGPQSLNYYLFVNALILLRFYVKGHYRRRLPWWQQVRAISKTIGIVMILTILVRYIFDLQISIIYVLCGWVWALALILSARWLLLHHFKKSKSWRLPITIFGDNQMIMDCMFAFYNDGLTGFHVENIMLRDKEKKPVCLDYIPMSHPPIKLIDASGDYLEYIAAHPHSFYVIGLEGVRGKNRDALTKALEDNEISYAIVPPTKRLHLYGMEPQYFFGNDVLLLHQGKRSRMPVTPTLKRAFDICVSGIFLPALGLFSLFIYLAKKMEGSQTPVFYGGVRLGKDGKEFPCWKFCTMRKDADSILEDVLAKDPALREEWDQYQKLKDDPRIDSRISKILRYTSLDELPQIWNIFVGDMSLVGPRPILPEQKKEYGSYMNLYEEVRPGITGLWQVSGRNETTFQQRVYWDSWYVKNWSLWHDIVILFKTVGVVITRHGAY